MKVEISNGELLDKFSILQIKLSRITDDTKLDNVRNEFYTLKPLCEQLLTNVDVTAQYMHLLKVNESLWDIEDEIREKEKLQQFDSIFIGLARSVYFTNDKRAQIKKQINIQTNSLLVEEKSYKGL